MAARPDKAYRLKAEVLSAMAHPLRLATIEFLAKGEQCVCDIARHVGAGRPNISRHLAVLLSAGVVECRKNGLRMMYRLKCPCVLNFIECVGEVLRTRAAESQAVLEHL